MVDSQFLFLNGAEIFTHCNREPVHRMYVLSQFFGDKGFTKSRNLVSKLDEVTFY